MIYLFTGSNGSGKTLESIRFIEEQLRHSTSDERPVFYNEHPEQTLDIDEIGRLDWTQCDDDDIPNWKEAFPYGAIIFVDEFYRIFPYAGTQDKSPQWIKDLSVHRAKYGLDFVLTSQKCTGQFDASMQGFIRDHRHLIPKTKNTSDQIQFNEFCNKPVSPPALLSPTVSTLFHAKKFHGTYRYHGEKTDIDKRPWKKLFLIIAALILFFSYFGYSVYKSYNSSLGVGGEVEIEDGLIDQPMPAGFRTSQMQLQKMSDEDWFAIRKARVPSFPHTAPIYDELTVPLSYPKISCAAIQAQDKTVCNCVTQQFSKVLIDQASCLSIAANGWFDHSEPDQLATRNTFEDSSTPVQAFSNNSFGGVSEL